MAKRGRRSGHETIETYLKGSNTLRALKTVRFSKKEAAILRVSFVCLGIVTYKAVKIIYVC